MDINEYTDLNNVTIAEFKAAIYNNAIKMKECLKTKDIKGFLNAFKINLKLSKLLDKKVSLVRKENDRIEKQR